MAKRQTAGALTLKAQADETKYDPLEVGHALTDDVIEQVMICGKAHEAKFDEEEYCVILLVASDCLIAGIRRHKYYAFPYLPKPRPQQSVFLYNKKTHRIKRLWSLPDPKVMAIISEMPRVDAKWAMTKSWCDAFYDGMFFQYIRQQHGIKHLSESEYLNAHREELIKAGCKQTDSLPPEPFDFSKVTIKHVVDTDDTIANKNTL